MDEIQTVERMRLVLDAPVHMRAADCAGVALDSRRTVDDLELVAVLEHFHFVARYNRDHRKGCALRLPAFGATAGVVVGDVAGDGDLDRLVLAFADQGAAGEAAGTFLPSVVNRWGGMRNHSVVPPCALRSWFRKR